MKKFCLIKFQMNITAAINWWNFVMDIKCGYTDAFFTQIYHLIRLSCILPICSFVFKRIQPLTSHKHLVTYPSFWDARYAWADTGMLSLDCLCPLESPKLAMSTIFKEFHACCDKINSGNIYTLTTLRNLSSSVS